MQALANQLLHAHFFRNANVYMTDRYSWWFVVVVGLGVIGVMGVVAGCFAWNGAGAGWGRRSSPSSSSSVSRRLGVLVAVLDVETRSSLNGLSVADVWVEHIVDRHETFLYRESIIGDRLCLKFESTGSARKERRAIKVLDAGEGDLGVIDTDAVSESMRISGTRNVVLALQIKSHWQGESKIFDVEVRQKWNSLPFETFGIQLSWPE